MSILTLDKEEALSHFNRRASPDYIDKLKSTSDAKNDTSELTFSGSATDCSHGLARMKVDAIRDERALRKETDDLAHCEDIE